MGASPLGAPKMRAIERAVGVPIRNAVVWCHNEQGRWARFFTTDGRKGYFDRKTGEWEFDED